MSQFNARQARLTPEENRFIFKLNPFFSKLHLFISKLNLFIFKLNRFFFERNRFPGGLRWRRGFRASLRCPGPSLRRG